MKQQGTFEEHLRKSNLSENTITSYLWTVEYYHAHYDGISKENLLAYKGYLMEFYKPKTVNLRIQAINKYLTYLGKDKLLLQEVVIGIADHVLKKVLLLNLYCFQLQLVFSQIS